MRVHCHTCVIQGHCTSRGSVVTARHCFRSHSWQEQAKAIKRVAEFVHAQGSLCGVQLAHAGRKASTVPPWVAIEHGKASMKADESVGGVAWGCGGAEWRRNYGG